MNLHNEIQKLRELKIILTFTRNIIPVSIPDSEIYLPTTPLKLFHKHCPSHRCPKHEHVSG
jgi:hypothetical protein